MFICFKKWIISELFLNLYKNDVIHMKYDIEVGFRTYLNQFF